MVLRNTFITRYHKRNRARDLAHEVESQMDSLGQGVAVAHQGNEAPQPDEAMSSKIEQTRILEALDSLPEDYRMAVTLADLQGLAYKEIAEVMNCPVGTVMSRIYRGRKILYKLLLNHATETGRVTDGAVNPRKNSSGSPSVDEGEHHKVEPGAPVSLGDYRANRIRRTNG